MGLTNLALKAGYWRPSVDSVDVRRCPDAGAVMWCKVSPDASTAYSGNASAVIANASNASTGMPIASAIVANASNTSSPASDTAACETISLSACRGGSDIDATCGPNLTGPFCMLCSNASSRSVYVRPASESWRQPAACASCDEERVVSDLPIYAALVAASLLLLAALRRWIMCSPVLVRYWAACKPHVKLKVRPLPKRAHACRGGCFTERALVVAQMVVGLYAIVTQIEEVFEVTMPTAVREFLRIVRFVIGLGLADSDQVLTCLGARGFLARMWLWIVFPLFLVVVIVVAVTVVRVVAHVLRVCRRGRVSPAEARPPMLSLRRVLLTHALPIVLWLLFIFFPLVTNVAFDAFSCYAFSNGTHNVSVLRVDVSIECTVNGEPTDAWREVLSVATVAISIYPVGLLILCGALLLSAHRAIVTEAPSALSTAISFLHREYDCARGLFWWELCEMSRRIVLVGVFVLIQPGSVVQIVGATFVCIMFFSFQVQLQPYREVADNYLANACSCSLILIFLCCMLFKMWMLLEPPELMEVMNAEQRDDSYVDAGVLGAVLLGSVVVSLVASLVMLAAQIRWERQRRLQEMLQATAKRLRYVEDDELVVLPSVAEGYFHLFLSHAWGTGQDQMRIVRAAALDAALLWTRHVQSFAAKRWRIRITRTQVKLRLLEMLPEARIFLDVRAPLRRLAAFVDLTHRTRPRMTACVPA